MALADRIAILDNGVLQQVGTPYDVYNFPANEFVAGFIGEPPMNIFPVTVERSKARLSLPGTAFSLPVPAELHHKTPLKLGIRTHRIGVQRQPGPNTTPAEVAVAEHLGDETRLLIRYGDTDLIVTLPIQRTLRAKDLVHLYFDAAHTLFFDAETGERIVMDVAPRPTAHTP